MITCPRYCRTHMITCPRYCITHMITCPRYCHTHMISPAHATHHPHDHLPYPPLLPQVRSSCLNEFAHYYEGGMPLISRPLSEHKHTWWLRLSPWTDAIHSFIDTWLGW